jgi:hypothetical protein
MSLLRTRWTALGAAIAITLGGGGIGLVSAGVSSGERTVFVPVTPCRIIDTRPALQVGPRNTPLGTAETHTVSAHGTNGDCTIPTDAVALSLNVTAVGATLPTFLTVWATGVTQPDASSLNPTPGAPPAPNAVTTELSATGQFNIFNLQGNVHVLADVNGYYADHNHDDRYYTEAEVDSKDALKADAADVYTKTEADAVHNAKADVADVYTKTDIDSKLNRSISISGAAFRPRSAMTTSTIGSGGELFMASGTDDRFYAPLVLPDGATITAVHATLWDAVLSDSLRLEVQRVAFISGYSTIATIESTTSVGADTSYTAPSVVNGTIDTTLYTYVVSIYDPAGVWATHGSDLRFQGIRIEYTI